MKQEEKELIELRQFCKTQSQCEYYERTIKFQSERFDWLKSRHEEVLSLIEHEKDTDKKENLENFLSYYKVEMYNVSSIIKESQKRVDVLKSIVEERLAHYREHNPTIYNRAMSFIEDGRKVS